MRILSATQKSNGRSNEFSAPRWILSHLMSDMSRNRYFIKSYRRTLDTDKKIKLRTISKIIVDLFDNRKLTYD